MSEPAAPEAPDTFVAGARSDEPRWRIFVEILVLYLVVNGIIAGLRVAWTMGMPDLVLGVVPVLFMYAPVLVCRLRGVDSWAYPLALPSLRDWSVWKPVLVSNALLIGGLIVPFVAGYHVWHTYLLADSRVHDTFPVAWPTLGGLLLLIGYHLFFVAIPEEFFYRGYMQTRLNEAFDKRYRVLGAVIGPGLFIATVLFAFGHTIVVYQWWHVFIIGPGLIFAWLRARTGDVMAGAFFHAWCNVTVTLLDIAYGLQPPT